MNAYRITRGDHPTMEPQKTASTENSVATEQATRYRAQVSDEAIRVTAQPWEDPGQFRLIGDLVSSPNEPSSSTGPSERDIALALHYSSDRHDHQEAEICVAEVLAHSDPSPTEDDNPQPVPLPSQPSEQDDTDQQNSAEDMGKLQEAHAPENQDCEDTGEEEDEQEDTPQDDTAQEENAYDEPNGKQQDEDDAAAQGASLADLSITSDGMHLSLGPSLSADSQQPDPLMAPRRRATVHRTGRQGVISSSQDRGRTARDIPLTPDAPLALAPTLRRAAERRGFSTPQTGAIPEYASPHATAAVAVEEDDLRSMRRRRRGGAHTVLVIDGSASLGHAGLTTAAEAASAAVARVSAQRGLVSVVMAAGQRPAILIQRCRRSARALQTVRHVPAGGGMPLAPALETACGLLAEDQPPHRRILLITDGEPTVGFDQRYLPREAAGAELVDSLAVATSFCTDVSILPVGLAPGAARERSLAPFRSAGVTVLEAGS